MDELRRRYASLTQQYETIATDALTNPDKLNENVARLININTQISSTLDEMISILTLAKSGSAQMVTYRDELIQKLEKIQRDYNGLVKDSDKLETLRRIRAFEDESWKRTLRMYLIAFLAIISLVGILVMFKKGTQKALTTTATPISAAAMPALT
jgi:hypothetical protein